MKIVTYQGEQTLGELTRRVFDIQGAKTRAPVKQAESALLRANPQLGDLKKVSPGTVLVVPDVPGVEVNAGLTGVGVGQDVLAQLRATLNGARAAMERGLASEAQEAEATSTVVKSPDIKVLVRQMPDLKTRVQQITDDAKAAQKDIAVRKTAIAQGFAQLEKDLGTF